MKKQSICLVAVFIATSITPLNASRVMYLTDENENHYGDGQEVCANQPLNLVNADRDSEVLILDQTSKEILDVFNLSEENKTVMFPVNAGEITLRINSYDENSKIDSSEQQSFNLEVKDCGEQTETIVNDFTGEVNVQTINPIDEYKRTNYGSQIEYDGNELKVTPRKSISDYQLDYQYIEDDKIHMKKLRFREGVTTKTLTPEYNIVQFHEQYKDQSNKIIDNYYEVELNSEKQNYTIRNVEEFSPHGINKIDLIDWQVIVWLFFLTIFYGTVNVAYRRQRRRYRRHVQKEQNE